MCARLSRDVVERTLALAEGATVCTQGPQPPGPYTSRRSRASQPLSKLAGSAIGVDAPSGPPHPQQQHHHALQASGTQSFALQAGSGDGSSLARQWKVRGTLLARAGSARPVGASACCRLLQQLSLVTHKG